jgi:hypothetical protein
MLPAGVLKHDYPSWNHNQIINYRWSSDINEGTDNIGFSLADNPYLPPSVAFGERFAHNYQVPVQVPVQVPIQVPTQVPIQFPIQVPNLFQGLVPAQVPVLIETNKDQFQNEDDFITPLALPQAPTPTSPGPAQTPTTDRGAQATTTSSRGLVRPSNVTLQKYGIKPYYLANAHPELQEAPTFKKPAKSPTSMWMKRSTSRRPTTSTPSSGSFRRKRAGLRGPTRPGSVPFSQRKRISTPNHRLLIQLIIIIMCSLLIILTDNIKSMLDFHLVFEEIGLMASSTDYQLATMKVNLMLLENTVDAFKNNVILQQKFIEKTPPPIYQKHELIIPIRFSNHTKEKLLANT